MAPIYLYAELLLNIRQVTIFALLPSNCDQKTHASISSDQKILLVQHDSQEASIELPCQVTDSTALKTPAVPTKELSFRLSVSISANLSAPGTSANEASIPWPASKLTSETQLACQCCGNLFVKDVAEWKDLPSGGWADMMDFWHCHKPSTENGQNDSVGNTKGYAAANDLGPTIGVGLVDISHFLFAECDCIGMQVCGCLYLLLSIDALRVHGQQEGGLRPILSILWQGRRYNCPRIMQTASMLVLNLSFSKSV